MKQVFSYPIVRFFTVAGLLGALFMALVMGVPSVSYARSHPDVAASFAMDSHVRKSEPLVQVAQRRKFQSRRSERRTNNRKRSKNRNLGRGRSLTPARRGYDNRQSRRAITTGRAMPLGQVARNVRRRVPGQLLDAGLSNGRNGKLVYKLKILGKKGVIRRVTTDATTGRILNIR